MKKFVEHKFSAPVLLTEEEKTIFSDHSRTNLPPPKKKQKRKKRKQISVKKFFLTFPKCNVEPTVALNNLIFKYPCKWAIVSQENHLDGSLHLHLAFWLKDMIRYRDAHLWDFIAMKHGDYQVAKNIVKVVKYVTKDKNFVTHQIDVETWLKSHQTKTGASFELVAKMMMQGKSLDELNDLYPGMISHNLAKLKLYRTFLDGKKRREKDKELQNWTPLDIGNLDLDFRILGLWMNKNLNGIQRPFKAPQLWLWGCSNLGKTSLIISLKKYLRIYMVPMDVRHLDDYEDDQYDLIVLDEFKAQKSITWLNGFIQGNDFPVHRRYSSTLKTKNLPVIVLSNYSIEGAYEKVNMFNPERLNSLKNRFTVVHVNKFIDLKIK